MSSYKTYKAKMDRLYKVDEAMADRRTVPAITTAKTKEELKWYQKGEFADGYQFGDILKTLFGDSATKEKENAPTAQKAMVDLSQWERGWENYLADEQAAKAEKAKTPWWLQALTRSFSTANENPVNVAMNNVVYNYRNDDSYKKPTDQWTEGQKQYFGAYYLSDPETAYDYAISVNDAIDQAAKDKQIQDIEKAATSDFWSGAKHTAGAILTAPFGLADYLDNLAETSARGRVTTKPTVTPLEYSDTVTGSITNKLNEYSGTLNENIPLVGGKGLGDVYGAGVDALQRQLIASTGEPVVALISYFGQNAARGIDNALARGATAEQAVGYGTVMGLADAIPEMIGMDKLLNIDSASTLKGVIGNVLGQAGVGALSGGTTALVSAFADNFIMRDKSEFNMLVDYYMIAEGLSEREAKKQAWKTSAREIADGILSNVLSNAANGLVQTAKANYRQRQSSYDLSDTPTQGGDGLYGPRISDDAYFRMLQRYVDEGTTGEDVGKHYEQMVAGIESESRSSKALENDRNGDIIKLSNIDVRRWYVDAVSRIKENIPKNLPIEEQARLAFEARNEARKTARQMMSDTLTRQMLDENHPNKTFEELIQAKMQRKSMTREEAIQDVFETATKTNDLVNKELGLE